ncbi:hypothetical protein LOAG_07744 [Loa loa]|uniref:USP domain-containing protein n=1 Tax=Loa loa TaxID=7209 RepID=A0A1S0TV62_LOALO|nr:hypothetical protein LOAG_07744 [Loa loa]EFO20744.1 hypothetical protein LOAG_07744 [Loa loa]
MMTMLVLEPGQFRVQVIYGSKNTAPTRRLGIFVVDEMQGEIIFLFDDCHLVVSFKALSGFPWLPPSKSGIGFWIKGREKMAFVVEFENPESMKQVHELLKTKYLVRRCFDRCALDSALEPRAKRSRLSNPLSGITHGSLQVEYPLIRSKNFIATRVNLTSSNEKGHRGSKHISALRINNVETSGFVNLGNTCYMGSMLQGLFADVIFAKDLFKFCKMVEELGLNLNEEMPLSLAIANLASRRHRATNYLKMALLAMIQEMSNLNLHGDAQQDAQEFLANILNKMQEECDKILCKQYNIEDKEERSKRNPVTSNFAFVMESIIRCRSCNAVTKNKEESVILPVSIQMVDQDGVGCLIVFIKRYSFNACAAVKRDDEVGVPLYLTLTEDFTEGAAPFPPLSPTTMDIDFSSAKMLKINLFRYMRKFVNRTPTDAKGVSSSSVGAAESSKTGTPEFVIKSSIPTSSAAVFPEIIHTESWKALKVDDEVASNKHFPPGPVSRRTTGNKLDMQSKSYKVPLNSMDKKTNKKAMSGDMLRSDDRNSDDELVYPMPVSHNSILDHDNIQPNFLPTSSEDENRNFASKRVYPFTKVLIKAKRAEDKEKGKLVDSKSLSNQQWDENTGRSNWCNPSAKNDAQSSKKDDLVAVAADLSKLAATNVSRVTIEHREKEVEEVDTSKEVSVVPYKPKSGECNAVSDSTDGHGKSKQLTAVQDHMLNIRVDENYFADLKSKINVLTPDGRGPFQPESTLKAGRLPREQRLLSSFFAQTQRNLSRIDNPTSKGDYTDEELYFMTEEEQIMAACERSIADQLKSSQKGNEISAEISQESDEESLRIQDEPMSQELSSPDSDEDLKLDVEVVEVVDCSQKFHKQENEQSVDKLMSQKSSSPVANVEAEMVAETKNYPKKFNKEGGKFEGGRNLYSNNAQEIAECEHEDKVGIRILEKQGNTDVNEKAVQGNNQNTFGIEGEDLSKPSKSLENVLPNTDSTDSSAYKDTNQSDEN